MRRWIGRTCLEQKRQVRKYLKRVRWRMKRRQIYFLYALAAAAALYLSGVWQLRERIWSVSGTEEVEYQMPGWKMGSESGGEEKKEGTSTRIRFHLKTGDLEILHERNEPFSQGE